MQKYRITTDTPLKPHNKNWQFCVGSGNASLALRSDYLELLKLVHDELGIKRVRFHGIFSERMHTKHSLNEIVPIPFSKRFKETSFRQCGIAYDNVLAAGMEPFVELSFMPRSMAKNGMKGLFYYKPHISMPKSDDEWSSYIRQFIIFLQNRYGKEEVRKWFFEVWNEPDLIAFFSGRQKDYFHLYEITAKAVKSVDSNIPVGGPSTSGSTWVDAFTRYCKSNNIPLDFVTTHQYSGDPLGGVDAESSGAEKANVLSQFINSDILKKIFVDMGRQPRNAMLPALRAFMGDQSEEKDCDPDTFRKAAPIVKKQAQGLPVYYTEWNMSAVFSAYSNDTRKVAAYDMKTALALDDVIDGSSIWCFSDIFEEFHQFPEEFHGGFGMLTQSGIKKPVFHGMKMLADAADRRYDIDGALDGEISFAAFKSETETQLLFIRQKLKNLFSLPKEEITVEAELPRKPKRVYLQRIDDNHCNPLKLWEKMGSPQVPTPTQLEELKARSALTEEELPIDYSDGVLTVTAKLGVNDIWFVRVEE